MDKTVEVAIEKINQLKLEKEKSFENKKDLLVLKILQIEEKEENLLESRKEIKKYFTDCEKKDGYLDVVLFCYNKLLEKENKTFRVIFEKFKSLVECKHLDPNVNSNYNKSEMDQILKAYEEIFNLKNQVKALKKEISDHENSTEDEQWIEDLKNLSESHLEAMKISEDWHLRDLEEKVEEKLRKLLFDEKTENLFEQV